MKKRDKDGDFFQMRWIYSAYVTEVMPEGSFNAIWKVEREKVVEDLKRLIREAYWTDEELIKFGKYRRPCSAGPRRHKIPEDMQEIDARNRVYRQGHKKLAPGRKVLVKKYRSTMIFKKFYKLSYLKYRFRQQILNNEKFKLKVKNVFEDPVLVSHKKER